MRLIILALGAALIATAAPAQAKHHHKSVQAGDGLAGATLLLVRHAEKPESGQGLTPAGEARARAYASYFRHFALEAGGPPARIDAVVATLDTPKSARPRLTVEPIAHALGVPVQQPVANEDVTGLADWLHHGAPKRTVLIAWHHGKLPKLLEALNAGCAGVVPDKWPDEVYDWVVVVRYGKDGTSKSCKLVEEPAGMNTPTVG